MAKKTNPKGNNPVAETKPQAKQPKKRTERVLNTEHLYSFRKGHQKRRKNRKKQVTSQNPVFHLSILVKDGIAKLGEVCKIQFGKLFVLGKGTKNDGERGRCVIWTTSTNVESNDYVVLERTR